MQNTIKKKTNLTPMRIMAIRFAVVIFIGTVLLMMPESSIYGRRYIITKALKNYP